MKTLQNIVRFFTPTYVITYAPEKARVGSRPIKRYRVLGNPTRNSFTSSEGKVCFRARVENRKGQVRTFRADRCLSVNFKLFGLTWA